MVAGDPIPGVAYFDLVRRMLLDSAPLRESFHYWTQGLLLPLPYRSVIAAARRIGLDDLSSPTLYPWE